MVHKKTVACNKGNLKSIREFVLKSLKAFKVDEVQANLIVLAVDEVCANRMIHTHQCDEKQLLELRIITEKEGLLTVEISDNGDCFDIESYQVPSMDHVIEKKKSGGMGLILVKKIMDNVQVETIGNLNVFKLFKQLDVA